MSDDNAKGGDKTITVAGVTFNATQVKSATVLIEGREVYIGERDDSKPIGFRSDEDNK